MFQIRDLRICSAHHDIHNNERHYIKRLPSLFFSSNFLNSLMEDTLDVTEYFPTIQTHPITDYSRIFCTYQPVGSTKKLIVLDVKCEKIYLLDPLVSVINGDLSEVDRVLLDRCLTKLRIRSEQLFCNFENWTTGLYPYQYYQGLTEQFIYLVDTSIITMIYFLVNESPIFFTPELLNILRKNFCYWLMNEEYPI